MKNVIRTTTSGFKNKVRGGGVLSKTLLTTAIFAALTSAAITAQGATTNWYFGSFGQDLTALSSGQLNGWVNSTTVTEPGLSYTPADATNGGNPVGSVVLEKLGLTYSAAEPANPNFFMKLDDTAASLTILSVLANGDAPTTMSTSGFTVTGSLLLNQTEGETEKTGAETFEDLVGGDSGVTVLQIAKSDGQTLGLTNNGNVKIEFETNGGVALTGLTIEKQGTYTSNGTGSISVTSDAGVTAISIIGSGTFEKNETYSAVTSGASEDGAVAVDLQGTGVWKAGFTAYAESNGESITAESEGTPASSVAVKLDQAGSKGTWTGGFDASAVSSGLSPSATGLLVTNTADSAGVVTINAVKDGTISISAELTTDTPTALDLTSVLDNGFTATAVDFQGGSSATATISGNTPKAGNTAAVNSYIDIGATLTISGTGDLVKQAEGEATNATATGIAISGGTLNVTAGALAPSSTQKNVISASVITEGGALTTESTVSAYAVNATDGTLNVTLADTTLTAGKSSAVLNITAENNASFATDTEGTATAAAIVSKGGTSAATNVYVNAQAGTINIEATGSGSNVDGSQAYGVWAQGGTSAGNVYLYGTNQMNVSSSEGYTNNIFVGNIEGNNSPYDPYKLVTTPDVTDAAIYSDGTSGAANVYAGVTNMTVNGNVVALATSTTNKGTIVFTGAKAQFGDLSPDDDIATNTTIAGNLYALNGGVISVGASTPNTMADAVSVNGDTYIVGASTTANSTLNVYQKATYTAQGQTVVANGGRLAVEGGTYIANDAVTVSNQNPVSDATGTFGVYVGTGTVGGTMTANSTTTLTQTGKLTINGNSQQTAATYNALGDMTIGDPLTSGQTEVPSVTGTVALTTADWSILNIGDGTQSVTATVNLGGQITGNGTVNVMEGSTLALTTTPNGVTATAVSPMIASTVVSKVYGTVQILGSNQIPATEAGVAPTTIYYKNGLGNMSIQDGGSVIGDEGGLYLGLIAGDSLTFDGGSMEADIVNVGMTETGASLEVAGGSVSTDQLIIAASNTVTLSDGLLTITDTPAPAVGEELKSNLSNAGTFTLSGTGVLKTNSLTLWEEVASEDPDAASLTPTSGPLTYEGGFVELTDEVVDTAWLEVASGVINKAVFIIDGQVYQDGKLVTSVRPNAQPAETTPDLSKTPVFGTLMPKGGILAATALDATQQTFTPKTGKATTYQNLVIGGDASAKTPWTQTTGNLLWNINPNAAQAGTVGFSSIQLGDSGNILVTGNDTLVLVGTGAANPVVTGTGVTIFVGSSSGNGTLVLGSLEDSGIAKGGTLDGAINVANGTLKVGYADYTVGGALTLGVAPTGNAATPGATGASFGSLSVQDGSLAVQSLVGTSLNTVYLSSGTLNVKEDFTANVNSANPGNGIVLGSDSHLVVGQNLSIKSITPATNRGQIGLFASESDVSVGGELTATDASIELAGSSLQVNGSYQQTDTTQNKMVNDLALRLTNVGEVVSTLQVKGDLTTTANNIVIVNSTVEVSGDLNINGQTIGTGTSAQRPTGLVLNGAQLKATNINLNNVRTGLIPETTDNQDSNYLSGDIKATGTLAVGGVSDVALNDGTLEAAVVTIGQDATLTLGVPADVLETLTERRDGNLPDIMVVDASIGQVDNLQGTLEIGGVAPAGEGQTEVAIGNLTFDIAADEDNPANVVIDGASAIVLGNTSVEVLDTVTPLIAAKAPEGAEFTNYLVAGQTVRMGDYNGFAIGTAATAQNSGLSIEEGTAVAVDAKSLALSGGVQDKTITLFSYAGEEAVADAPEVSIAPTAFFLVTNPVGNMKINVAQGFNTEGIEVTSDQVKTSNPLYTAEWYVENDAGTPSGAAEGGAEIPVESAIISVTIDPVQVSGTPDSVNSLATNTILEAAEMGYGVNEGANTILDLLAPITSTAQYGDLRNAINSIALRGAAAHAHEIGISAASMVIDSVWDHTSKLAAAPHEEAKADLWITLDWNHSRANDYKAGGLDNGYKLDLYGATFGADYDFANGLAAGLAVSVGGGEAKSKGFNAGQKTDVTYWGINLYGTYTSPIVNVIGNVGYIGIKNKTKISGDKGRPDANIWTIGVKAEKDFAINEQFTVTPHVGIRYLSVDVDDFNLQGFHYGTDKANLVQFPIGVAFAANLKTANGAAVKPFLDLSFVPTAGDKNVNNTFGIQGGTMSDTIDTTIASGAMFQGKIGVNASYGAHNFGLNFAIGGGNKGRLDTGLQAKYRFVF